MHTSNSDVCPRNYLYISVGTRYVVRVVTRCHEVRLVGQHRCIRYLKATIPCWSSRHGRLVVDVVPGDLVRQPCCCGCANSEHHARIKRLSQQPQHFTAFACVGKVGRSTSTTIPLTGIGMLRGLGSGVEVVPDDDRSMPWESRQTSPVSCKSHRAKGLISRHGSARCLADWASILVRQRPVNACLAENVLAVLQACSLLDVIKADRALIVAIAFPCEEE